MESNGNAPESPARTAAHFASTHWSTVLAARESAALESQAALERLCQTYWYPLYAFVRRQGHAPEDARDLTQAFFERFIEKRFLKNVAPENGRFRTFLLTALQHFLANEWDRVRTAKRGGKFTFISLNAAALEQRYEFDAASREPPEHHYDHLWAEAVMEQALAALETECREAGKAAHFEALVGFLSDPPGEGEYALVGEQLGLNRHAVAVAVARLRERYAALVRGEIAHTVDQQADVEAEVRYLIEVVSR